MRGYGRGRIQKVKGTSMRDRDGLQPVLHACVSEGAEGKGGGVEAYISDSITGGEAVRIWAYVF